MNKNKSNRRVSRYQAWDKKYLWHPFTQHFQWEKDDFLIIDSAQGVYLKDLKGRRYVDGVSSLWVNLHGHRHPVLDQAIKKQLNKMAHSTFLGLSHVPAIELAKELISTSPRGLTRVFYSDSGATAIEIALKMAYQYWLEKNPTTTQHRTEFLAVKGSYHGDTLGAVSVGGIGAFHSKFKPLLFKSRFAMAPACYRCPFNKTGISHRTRLGGKINFVPKPGEFRKETGCRWECLGDVEKKLKAHHSKIAAGILEPIVQGAAGMIVLPPGYVAGFQRLCKKYNALFIADEVATGFCRTGSLFAVDQENVRPDILCLAKSLTGGYAPLAATLTTEKIFQAFRAPIPKMKTFFHGHSYTAHPMGAAVALANLRLIKSTKLLEKTRRKAHLLKKEMESLVDHPHVGSVRQAGLMAGVELVEEKLTKRPFKSTLRMGARLCKALLLHGFWLRPLGDTLVIMPPPVISSRDLVRMIRSLKQVLLHEFRS